MQGGRLVFLLSIVAILNALKIFEPQHHRHKGVATYIIACAILAQAASLYPVLWPGTTSKRVTSRNSGPAGSQAAADSAAEPLAEQEPESSKETV